MTHNDIDVKAVKIMKLVQHAFYRNKNDTRFKRIFFASVAIKATLLNEMEQHYSAEKYTSCLKMYFAATPDPWLCASEVKVLLYACFTITQTFYAPVCDNFCQVFGRLMTECTTRLEPRNLMDLARCQLRQNLSQLNVSLPAAIKNLNLPNILRRFVFGNLITISRKRIQHN